MTTRRSTTLVAGIAVAVLLFAGCGDDGGGGEEEGSERPTVDEVATAMSAMELDEQGLECVAQALVDSKVSDAGLQAIVDAGGLATARGVSAADQAEVQTALGEGIKCSIADEIPTALDPSTTEPGAGPSTEPGAAPSTEAPSTEAPTTAGG
jgi:hypothetical protein